MGIDQATGDLQILNCCVVSDKYNIINTKGTHAQYVVTDETRKSLRVTILLETQLQINQLQMDVKDIGLEIFIRFSFLSCTIPNVIVTRSM